MSTDQKKAAPALTGATIETINGVRCSTPAAEDQARSRCIRQIIGLVGRGGLEAFLRSRQPALGDRTGRELLDEDPAGLLARLMALEGGGE